MDCLLRVSSTYFSWVAHALSRNTDPSTVVIVSFSFTLPGRVARTGRESEKNVNGKKKEKRCQGCKVVRLNGLDWFEWVEWEGVWN